MSSSLRKTWIAVLLAIFAVLGVGTFVLRELVRDVLVACPTSVELEANSAVDLEKPKLEPVALDGAAPSYRIAYDMVEDHSAHLPYDAIENGVSYRNVRLVPTLKTSGGSEHAGAASDSIACICGEIPLALEAPMTPWDVLLARDWRSPYSAGLFVAFVPATATHAKNPTKIAVFRTVDHPTHRIVPARALAVRHVPSLVVLVALVALLVAALRSRRAIAYASRMCRWTEARLTNEGRIEGELGETYGVVESKTLTRLWAEHDGPDLFGVLVAPEALATSGLYRDVPIVQKHHVAWGTHSRWLEGTERRLRDARVLAVLSAACTGLALVARILGA